MLALINRLRFGNPWKYKAPLLICWAYVMILLTGTEPWLAFYFMLLAFSTLFGMAALGYFINDLADISSDKKAGKDNYLSNLSTWMRLLVLSGLLLFSFVPWIWFPKTPFTYVLIGTEIFLFVMYSLPPFRLKQRGILGVFTDALYAYIVPSVLACYTFYQIGKESYIYFGFLMVAISVWLMIVGIRGILLHQLHDYENDLKAGVKTFVTKKGLVSSAKMVSSLLPFEAILMTGFFVFVIDEFYLLFPGLLLFCLYEFALSKKNKEKINTKDYRKFSNRFFDGFYLDFLPVIILIQLCFINYYYSLLLVLHLIFFRSFIKNILRKFIRR